jgi:hypothetical protein
VNKERKEGPGLTCPICQREATEDFGYCDEHRLQYLTRQREGVSTEELDSRWGDTLANWHERPSSLDREVGSRELFSALFFTGRHGNWLLFVRGYQTRLMDGLAINQQTEEIRRFVDVSEEAMWEDLRGERPTAYQTELAPFWGISSVPNMHEQWTRQFLDAQGRILLPQLTLAAPFPIYGLVGNPLRFLLCRLPSWGSSNYQVRNITLTFCRSHPAHGHDIFELTSFDAKQYSGVHDLDAIFDDPDADATNRLLQRYHLPPALMGSPAIWKGEITITQSTFVSEVRFWSRPLQLLLFELKGSETILIGNASGLSFEELVHLLQGLVVLNHQSDLLLQYQHTLEQRR